MPNFLGSLIRNFGCHGNLHYQFCCFNKHINLRMEYLRFVFPSKSTENVILIYQCIIFCLDDADMISRKLCIDLF